MVVGALLCDGDLQARGVRGVGAPRPAYVQVRHQREASLGVGAPGRAEDIYWRSCFQLGVTLISLIHDQE